MRATISRIAPIEAKILKRRLSMPRRSRFAIVRNSMRVIADTPGGSSKDSVWAVTMVRNEADILESTLKHLIKQEVDGLIIVDNDSTDATPEIIANFRNSVPMLWLNSTLQKRFQAELMTSLAQRARARGAKWIIPFDGDEFWFATERTLGAELRSSTGHIRTAQIFNAFPRFDTNGYNPSAFRLDATPHRSRKVAPRSSRFLYIEQGNHDVERRGIRQPGLSILHFPWRSLEQLAAKARRGRQTLEAAKLPASLGFHLRWLGGLSDSELQQV